MTMAQASCSAGTHTARGLTTMPVRYDAATCAKVGHPAKSVRVGDPPRAARQDVCDPRKSAPISPSAAFVEIRWTGTLPALVVATEAQRDPQCGTTRRPRSAGAIFSAVTTSEWVVPILLVGDPSGVCQLRGPLDRYWYAYTRARA